jgi:ribonuclease P protein component
MSESDPVRRTKGVRAGASIGRAERIAAQGDFARAYKDGRRGGDQLIRLIVCRNDLGHPRIAFAVGRKSGGATHRNRLRRLYREAFRLEKANLPPVDVIVSPAREGADPELVRVRRSLVQLVNQIASRLPRSGPEGPRGAARTS